MVVDNEMDHRYLALFRDELSFRLTPFTDNDPFHGLVLQASTIPSIRHTTVALAALAKTRSTLQEASSALSIESPEVKAHSDYSLRQYSKGLGLMRRDVAEGHQDLRTTLLTCLLIICVECVHGNYAMAGELLSNAMSLLKDWRDTLPNAASHPLGFSSPAPHIIEDSLVQIIGGLELQSFTFDTRVSRKQHIAGMDEGLQIVRDMPIPFQSTEQSRLYLELIARRCKNWVLSLGSLLTPRLLVNDEVESHNRCDATTSYDSDASSLYNSESNVQSPEQETVNSRLSFHLGELDRWKASWDAFVATTPAMTDLVRLREQLLTYKCAFMAFKAIVAGDEMVFDDYTDDMIEILDIAEEVITGFREQRGVTKFIIFQRCTIPLHFVGIRCRVPVVRRRAVALLRSLATQTLSDSALMADIAEYVIEVEEAEMIDGQIPAYARVRSVGASVNVNEKEVRLSCPHQVLTPYGPMERVERKTIPL